MAFLCFLKTGDFISIFSGASAAPTMEKTHATLNTSAVNTNNPFFIVLFHLLSNGVLWGKHVKMRV
jgi:hypothetical protein